LCGLADEMAKARWPPPPSSSWANGPNGHGMLLMLRVLGCRGLTTRDQSGAPLGEWGRGSAISFHRPIAVDGRGGGRGAGRGPRGTAWPSRSLGGQWRPTSSGRRGARLMGRREGPGICDITMDCVPQPWCGRKRHMQINRGARTSTSVALAVTTTGGAPPPQSGQASGKGSLSAPRGRRQRAGVQPGPGRTRRARGGSGRPGGRRAHRRWSGPDPRPPPAAAPPPRPGAARPTTRAA